MLSALIALIPSFRVVNSVLRLFNNKIGKNVTIHHNVRLVVPFNLSLGDNVTINSDCFVDSRAGVDIGENTMIGRKTSIYTLSHDVDDSSFKSTGKKVFIGKNVVVFPHVIIMPGVKIGDGAVIYPGSVVTREVSPFSKVAGVPAKKVGDREELIAYKLNYKMYWGV